MTAHRMDSTSIPIEVEPTEPDADGVRWRQYEPGTANARCSCGLTLDGPHSAVVPLSRFHLDN